MAQEPTTSRSERLASWVCPPLWSRVARRRSWCPTAFESSSQAPLLSGKPEAVGLADDGIAGDTPPKLLGNGARRLAREPQALEQVHSGFIPFRAHAELLT